MKTGRSSINPVITLVLLVILIGNACNLAADFYFSADSWRIPPKDPSLTQCVIEVGKARIKQVCGSEHQHAATSSRPSDIYSEDFSPLPRALTNEESLNTVISSILGNREVSSQNKKRRSLSPAASFESDFGRVTLSNKGFLLLQKDNLSDYTPYLVVLNYLQGDLRKNAVALRLADSHAIIQGSLTGDLRLEAETTNPQSKEVFAGFITRHPAGLLIFAALFITTLGLTLKRLLISS